MSLSPAITDALAAIARTSATSEASWTSDLIIAPDSQVILRPLQKPRRGFLGKSRAGSSPLDYSATYLNLSEYLLPEADSATVSAQAGSIIDYLIANHDPLQLLLYLAGLNHATTDHSLRSSLLRAYAGFLPPNMRERFFNALHQRGAGGKVFIFRPLIINAIREVILRMSDVPRSQPLEPACAAVLLTHAIGARMDGLRPSSEDVAGIPSYPFMEMIRLSQFSGPDDVYSLIGRTERLWREFGTRTHHFTPRLAPSDLLKEATGLTLEEILCVAFALYSHIGLWQPGRPLLLQQEIHPRIERNIVQGFLKHIGSTPEALRSAFQQAPKDLDVLPIQMRPVLQIKGGLLVLDEEWLIERATSGLFWLVHDYEKSRSEADRAKWSQVHSEMIELLAEEHVQHMAPLRLGETHEREVYMEEDLQRAYGGKACDAVIFFGSAYVAIEVVSGQLAIGTRLEASFAQFKKDTERLVLEKCEQLDATVSNLLNDESKLIGFAATRGVRILPVLIVGGGYPLNPWILKYLKTELAARGLLQQHRSEPLSVLDFQELEVLEALLEQGVSPVNALMKWHASGIAELPFRNFSLEAYDKRFGSLRPSRMTEPAERAFRSIIERFVSDEDLPEPEE